ncbi:MAG: type II toxin-antitoxin system VapC family toxin [Actinobacteria bacterium]|nr:type II toxin-antitoxin system VapC family toxin [Actinomycetota bacterium]
MLKNRVYADTNLFIRFFTGDSDNQSQESKKFLNQVSRGKYELFICDLIIAEIIYVLESIYHLDRNAVVEKILAIAEIDNAVIENRSIILKALDLYEEKNIDFIDAYLASHSVKNNCDTVFTFDKDFKKIDFIKKIIP